MKQDVYGEMLAAIRAARSANLLGGSYGGVKPPPFLPGHYYFCDGLFWSGGTMSLTANRLYTAWLYVDETTTFLGAWFRNSGTSDSGKNVRMCVADANSNLKKDFGAVALDGSAALRPIANSVTLTPGQYRVGIVSDSTPAIYTMSPYDTVTTAASQQHPRLVRTGLLSGAMGPASDAKLGWPFAEYAAFTYGAITDPITAMTTTINRSASDVAAMGLYL